ncbi:MAG: alcohol dehydrogenase [Myxococcales bacterium]|nr:alcohol dehydrogenase [Myxococcales bacterium]
MVYDDIEPEAGEVRIKVAFVGVNFADIMARMGLYPAAPPPPCVVGYEVSGTIEAVGEGVDDLAVGTEVCALTRFGGYSSKLCVPRDFVVEIPRGMRLDVAAALPVQYLTAYFALHDLANLKPNETVLIHAAAGGVGLAAVELARHRKARILGTASPRKHEMLEDLGVHHPIDYRNQDYEEVVRSICPEGVDIVLDPLGGPNWQKNRRLLRPFGRHVMYGVSHLAAGRTKRSLLRVLSTFGTMKKLSPVALMQKSHSALGLNLLALADDPGSHGRIQDALEHLMTLFVEHVIDPRVDVIFPFSEAHLAHKYIQDRKNLGKVLLVPDPD